MFIVIKRSDTFGWFFFEKNPKNFDGENMSEEEVLELTGLTAKDLEIDLRKIDTIEKHPVYQSLKKIGVEIDWRANGHVEAIKFWVEEDSIERLIQKIISFNVPLPEYNYQNNKFMTIHSELQDFDGIQKDWYKTTFHNTYKEACKFLIEKEQLRSSKSE